MAKEYRVSVKVTENSKHRYLRALESVGISESSMVKGLLDSACSYIETNGEFTLPSVVIPRSVYKKLVEPFLGDHGLKAAEDPENYGK